MNREEALAVLGLTEKSLQTDIETRYATLVKRYRSEQNNEKLEEISLAYNIVTGRYVEPVEDTPEMKKVVWGRTRKEWSNIWLYNKYKFLAAAAGVVVVIYFIVTVANNKPGDLKLAAVGDFYIPESETVTEYVLGLFEEYERIDVSSAFVGSSSGTGYDAAGEQKAMILMTVSGEDVIIVNKMIFDRYAPMGAFAEIDALFEEVSGYDQAQDIKPEAIRAKVKESEGVLGEEHIYGISLGDTQILNAIGIYGREQILTVSIKSKDQEKAKEFIRRLIADSGDLLPLVTPIAPPPTPTMTPDPTSSASSEATP